MLDSWGLLSSVRVLVAAGFSNKEGVSHNPTKKPPCNACRLSASGLPYLRVLPDPTCTVRTQETVLKTQDSESPPAVLKGCTAEYCYTVTRLHCYKISIVE